MKICNHSSARFHLLFYSECPQGKYVRYFLSVFFSSSRAPIFIFKIRRTHFWVLPLCNSQSRMVIQHNLHVNTAARSWLNYTLYMHFKEHESAVIVNLSLVDVTLIFMEWTNEQVTCPARISYLIRVLFKTPPLTLPSVWFYKTL